MKDMRQQLGFGMAVRNLIRAEKKKTCIVQFASVAVEDH